MESLADFLGVRGSTSDQDTAPAPSPKMARREFARSVLNSQTYRQSLLDRIVAGELPPGIEALLYHYAYGKPTDHVEVKDLTNRLEGLSAEQLEERAMLLAARARQLRQQAASDKDGVGLVH